MKKIALILFMMISIFIFKSKIFADYKDYKVGDKVTYNNIDFYHYL